jgi:hypothetical protein
MSKIFQYLDIKDHELISDKLYQYVLDHTDILEKQINWNTLDVEHVLTHIPELAKSVGKLISGRIWVIAIFYVPANFAGGVHIDENELDYRVLWPVHNCKGSYTKFFDLNGNKVIEKVNGDDINVTYLEVEERYPLIEIARAETHSPLVFHVKTPHGIYTNPEFTGPRLTATIGIDHPLENFLK